MTVFGIIPARAGSKRLPGKNLRPLGGVPLIGWTIAAAKRARTLTACWVSTDDPSIAEAARALGGEAPFLRPASLSGDDASSAAAARHALAEFESRGGKKADVVVLLQPTTPLLGADAIDAAVRLVSGGADSAQTVTLDEAHPLHKFRLRDGRLTPAFSDAGGGEPIYRPNGGAYAVRADLLREKGLLRGEDHRGVIMDLESSTDIDTLWDFRLVEAIVAETGRHP